jgi:FAD/FMN-containing dehydrogenase
MTDTIATVLGESSVQELRDALHGELVTPGGDGYEDVSRAWNGAHYDRRPALVARCRGAADVSAAIAFARRNDLELAVRGGGHSLPGFSTTDGGIVVDLGPMSAVRVDPVRRRAYVGGGAVWADVDHETQPHGLATPGGLISSTGVGGFALGGGVSWLIRKHGLSCDNLVAADVVTADGRLVNASATENPDLLWGLRGGGGNFGIVTQFEFELHPVGPIVYGGPIFFPAAAAPALLRRFRQWSATTPDEISALVNLTCAPPLPPIPQAWHGKPIAMFAAVSVGPVEDAAALVEEIRSVAEPIADLLGPIPYAALQSMLDPLYPKGSLSYFKATNLAELDDELIESFCELLPHAPGPQCEIHIHQLGGAFARVGEDETAFPERSAPFLLNALGTWHDPAAAEAHRDWARAVIAAAERVSTGRAYVNYLGDADAARSAYGEQKYDKLVALKNEYDPSNLFRLNQNIEPSSGS